MWEAVITAGVLSLLGGLVAQPPSRYRFWWKWAPLRFVVCLVPYLLGHAALGVVVALLADPANWHPFDNWFLAGLAYALVGQGLVRVAPQALSTDLTASRTLLSRIINFTVEAVNSGCGDKIEEALDALPWKSIAAQAIWMYERYYLEAERIPPNARSLALEELENAADRLQQDPAHLNGRGTLERFCIRLFLSRELSPRALKAKSVQPNKGKSFKI